MGIGIGIGIARDRDRDRDRDIMEAAVYCAKLKLTCTL